MRFYVHAQRNALILFKLALENGEIDAAQKDMEVVREAVRTNAPLWRSLSHPMIPLQEKVEVFKKRFTRSVAGMLGIIFEKRETHLLPAMADEYAKLVKKHKKVEELIVETAIPLDPGRLTDIGEKISKVLSRKFNVVERINPDLIGGVILRYRDWTADNSFRSRLDGLRKLMSE